MGFSSALTIPFFVIETYNLAYFIHNSDSFANLKRKSHALNPL